jgi:hypothetical protein
MESKVIAWLLEPDNPGVRVRTMTELCGTPDDSADANTVRQQVSQWLDAARDRTWMSKKGLALNYGLTALAEAGLRRVDMPMDDVVDKVLSLPYDGGCGFMMILRALVMLGYGKDARIKHWLAETMETQLPDGGWLCLHRVRKLDRVPKSCIKAAMHALLLAAEMKKRRLPALDGTNKLLSYFLKRDLFYRMDGSQRLVLERKPGKRMTDVYFPIEVMRIGLPLLLDAIATLGEGRAPELNEAWELLDSKRDSQGKVLLEGTMSKSYLPKEGVGRPSKWATFYALHAWKAREEQKRL